MKKEEYFYVECLNIVNHSIDDVYAVTASSLDELLSRLENGDDFADDTPYVPQIYWLTENQYNKFPYIVLDAEQALVSYCGGVQL